MSVSEQISRTQILPVLGRGRSGYETTTKLTVDRVSSTLDFRSSCRTSVTVTDNSPFQDYPHPDDRNSRSTITYSRVQTLYCIEFTDTTCLVHVPANYVSIVSVSGLVTSLSLYI